MLAGYNCPDPALDIEYCQSGYYCQEATHDGGLACPDISAGVEGTHSWGYTLYCPQKTVLYDVCPEGYICKNSSHREVCPEGSYCKQGANETIRCLSDWSGASTPESRCPAGSSSEPERWEAVCWPLVFLIVTALCVEWAVVACERRRLAVGSEAAAPKTPASPANKADLAISRFINVKRRVDVLRKLTKHTPKASTTGTSFVAIMPEAIAPVASGTNGASAFRNVGLDITLDVTPDSCSITNTTVADPSSGDVTSAVASLAKARSALAMSRWISTSDSVTTRVGGMRKARTTDAMIMSEAAPKSPAMIRARALIRWTDASNTIEGRARVLKRLSKTKASTTGIGPDAMRLTFKDVSFRIGRNQVLPGSGL